jgi:DNA-binding NarL/FixJ family response regulator
MHLLDRQPPDKSVATIVFLSRDAEFIERFRLLKTTERGDNAAIATFQDPLTMVVYLLEHSPKVVVFDIDGESPERNLETLRAIRLIRHSVPIILCASEHSTFPIGFESNVGIYYRFVKPGPDTELRIAIESAQRSNVR